MARLSFKEQIKKKFNYDVTGLGVYVDEQSDEIMEDLIVSSLLKSRISIMPNVKGSKEIKLKTSTPSLQAASSCGWTASGGIILTDVALATVRVKIQEEYCNEDLNDTWAQIENAAGANVQDEETPNFADTMIMYYQKRAMELDQNLMLNGDTASGDPNLVFYDGFVKLWDADGSLVNVNFSAPTGLDSTNAFDALKAVHNAIPRVLRSNGVAVEIICGYETAQACIDQIWNDKDYNAQITFEDVDGELTFILPSTTTRVRSYPQLDGTDKVYAVPYQYMFWGTDLESDIDGFEFKFNEHDEMLRFGVKWRSGINYVFPEYFVRITLTA